MKPTEQQINDYINKYSRTDDDLVEGWELNPEDDNGEFLVNMGYRWLEDEQVWLHRDDAMSEEECEIWDYININLVA